MVYLRAKQNSIDKIKRKKISLIVLVLVVVGVVLGVKSVRGVFVGGVMAVGRPIWHVGNFVSGGFRQSSLLFRSKNALQNENDSLKEKVNQLEATNLDQKSLFEENIRLKDMLDRKVVNNLVLGAILMKPSTSLYDTMIIDVGSEGGIAVGDKVFAYGNILIGEISEAYSMTAKVQLYSDTGKITNVILGNNETYFDMEGRGGGNFLITVPHDFEVAKGDQAVMPGIYPYVMGVVGDVVFDPRDPFKKVLLRAPVNIQELKFVGVDRKPVISM